MRQVIRKLGFVAAASLVGLTGGPALAGPPYATDDPAPTDPGHWEIYAFGAGMSGPGDFEGTTGLDINYGPVENVQLTATLPIEISADGATHAGPGNIEVGVKYRFIHNEDAGLSVALFPRVFLPTAGHRFGSGRVGLLLPAWAQKDFGPWSLFGGGGYAINPGAGNRDYWQSGLALTRAISPRLSLGGEVTHQSPDAIGAGGTTALGLGGIYSLGGPFSVLVSGGPVFEHHRSGARFQAYAALGLSF
jgi:hypothetical protein